jgi:hypothetical protein
MRTQTASPSTAAANTAASPAADSLPKLSEAEAKGSYWARYYRLANPLAWPSPSTNLMPYASVDPANPEDYQKDNIFPSAWDSILNAQKPEEFLDRYHAVRYMYSKLPAGPVIADDIRKQLAPHEMNKKAFEALDNRQRPTSIEDLSLVDLYDRLQQKKLKGISALKVRSILEYGVDLEDLKACADPRKSTQKIIASERRKAVEEKIAYQIIRDMKLGEDYAKKIMTSNGSIKTNLMQIAASIYTKLSLDDSAKVAKLKDFELQTQLNIALRDLYLRMGSKLMGDRFMTNGNGLTENEKADRISKAIEYINAEAKAPGSNIKPLTEAFEAAVMTDFTRNTGFTDKFFNSKEKQQYIKGIGTLILFLFLLFISPPAAALAVGVLYFANKSLNSKGVTTFVKLLSMVILGIPMAIGKLCMLIGDVVKLVTELIHGLALRTFIAVHKVLTALACPFMEIYAKIKSMIYPDAAHPYEFLQTTSKAMAWSDQFLIKYDDKGAPVKDDNNEIVNHGFFSFKGIAEPFKTFFSAAKSDVMDGWKDLANYLTPKEDKTTGQKIETRAKESYPDREALDFKPTDLSVLPAPAITAKPGSQAAAAVEAAAAVRGAAPNPNTAELEAANRARHGITAPAPDPAAGQGLGRGGSSTS